MTARLVLSRAAIMPLIWGLCAVAVADPKEGQHFKPFIWPSEPPKDCPFEPSKDCPFEPSKDIVGIAFLGVHSDYRVADTWYPSWASDGNLYSPWTDGSAPRADGSRESSNSGTGKDTTTGQAVLIGDDPLNLKIVSLGLFKGDASPYKGRYPCGSLVYNNVWYYGTYCLAPDGRVDYGTESYNWPWLGPFVGFRYSTDFGKTWTDTPHTPAKSLFRETGMWGYPVKIGAPHFVDFGKNMEHSPDGKAYLVAHGAPEPDPKPRFGNLSWISGDQIYLLRVTPSIANMNDASKYEFYAGRDTSGKPIWTNDFARIQPLIDWNNNCGCVTVTYDAPLKKYLMCVTDGWPTCAKMSSYILEANEITGPWRLVTYMKDFGEQGYFLNIPTKFISPDGRAAWLCYSGNFAKDWRGTVMQEKPPGSHYGLVLQQIRLLDEPARRKYAP